MKKRFLSIISAVLVFITALVSLTACGKDPSPGIVDDENTINVRIRNAGYGKTYVEELAKQFNKTFESQGYKVNVLPPREDLNGENVLRNIYSDSGIDVYFTDLLTAENLAAHKDYGQSAADITDSVWNKKPIKADGTEEELTVAEKLAYTDTDLLKYGGKVYGLPYSSSFGVLAVNKKVLNSYGLELPRTTDEMFYCFDKIMEKALDTGVFPVTYSLNSNNYTMATLNPWIAQYNGVEEYNSFWSFQDFDGNDLGKDSYKVFQYDSVRVALEVMYRFADYNIAAYGSGSQEFKAAQAQLMKGTAVFYSVGDWMFNEEYYGFPDNRNDVTCINAPMVSALGKKLFGSGTKYGLDDEKADDVFSCIIKHCDEALTAEQIKPLVDNELSVNIDVNDVTVVCERRGIVRGSTFPGLIISEKSKKKDISALFLRFCASNDGGKIFTVEARTTSPYSRGEKIESEYEWVKAQSVIASNPYYKEIVSTDSGWGYRTKLGVYGIFPSPCMENAVILIDILKEKITKFSDDTLKIIKDDSIYKNAAAAKIAYMTDAARTQLETGKWQVTK